MVPATRPGFLTRLITQESHWRQLETSGTHIDQPLWGPPHGYGLMQLDPPQGLAAAFDWRVNFARGRAKIESGRQQAMEFWPRQILQWNNWNRDNPDQAVPMYPDQLEGLVWFTGKGTGAVIFQDAIWIKIYNEASSHYIS